MLSPYIPPAQKPSKLLGAISTVVTTKDWLAGTTNADSPLVGERRLHIPLPPVLPKMVMLHVSSIICVACWLVLCVTTGLDEVLVTCTKAAATACTVRGAARINRAIVRAAPPT